MSALDEIKAAKANLDHAKYEYKKENARITDKYHPLKIGDVVTIEKYAHIGKQFVVRHRGIKYERQWVATGPLIKKDGSESKQEGEWQQEITE